MAQIKHVFFDLDHTLWDFEKNSDLTFQKIFEINKVTIDINAFLKVYKPLNFKYWKMYREEQITKEALRYGRLKDTFDLLHFKISDAIIDILSEDYIKHLADFNHLFDGAFELLDYLKEKYTLHIITNGFDEIQTKKMINSKIYHYFNQIITSESVGVKKPNPKVFDFALETANANTNNSIMVGDSLEADIYGAINSGIPAIYFDTDNNNTNTKDYITVNSLLEIKQYL